MALTFDTVDAARAACGPTEVPLWVQTNPRTGAHLYTCVAAEATDAELWEIALTLGGRNPTPSELRILSGRQVTE